MPRKKSNKISEWVRRHQGKHLCHCGCNMPIEIRREHYRKSIGIPLFIKGHNASIPQEEVKEITEIERSKTSWDKLDPSVKEKILSNLNPFQSGEQNPSWKGGRIQDDRGYVLVLCPGHPFANDGYVLEHRLVVENFTRETDPNNPLLVEVNGVKYLKSESVVHHIDEVKNNNNIDNLMLLPNQAAHIFIHRSPLPMEERLRRIKIGVFHSGPLPSGTLTS